MLMVEMADLEGTKHTEMFDNDYVTPATACKNCPIWLWSQTKETFIDILEEKMSGFHAVI